MQRLPESGGGGGYLEKEEESRENEGAPSLSYANENPSRRYGEAITCCMSPSRASVRLPVLQQNAKRAQRSAVFHLII